MGVACDSKREIVSKIEKKKKTISDSVDRMSVACNSDIDVVSKSE